MVTSVPAMGESDGTKGVPAATAVEGTVSPFGDGASGGAEGSVGPGGAGSLEGALRLSITRRRCSWLICERISTWARELRVRARGGEG